MKKLYKTFVTGHIQIHTNWVLNIYIFPWNVSLPLNENLANSLVTKFVNILISILQIRTNWILNIRQKNVKHAIREGGVGKCTY